MLFCATAIPLNLLPQFLPRVRRGLFWRDPTGRSRSRNVWRLKCNHFASSINIIVLRPSIRVLFLCCVALFVSISRGQPDGMVLYPVPIPMFDLPLHWAVWQLDHPSSHPLFQSFWCGDYVSFWLMHFLCCWSFKSIMYVYGRMVYITCAAMWWMVCSCETFVTFYEHFYEFCVWWTFYAHLGSVVVTMMQCIEFVCWIYFQKKVWRLQMVRQAGLAVSSRV